MKKLVLLLIFCTIINFTHNLTEKDFRNMTAIQMANLVRDNVVTSEELVKMSYDILEKDNVELNAVITTRKEEALKEARNLKDTGQPFLGVPIYMKGLGYLHMVKDGVSDLGLTFNQGEISSIDGPLTQKLKELGFIVLGQTNFPEYGLRNITVSNLYGTAKNPNDINFHVGGSSGGSVAVVKSGIAPVASGSDGGGSIRIPSSWAGVIGYKPSRGIMFYDNKNDKNLAVHFPIVKDIDDAILLYENLKKQEIKEEKFNLKDITIGYTFDSPMGTEVPEYAKLAILDLVDFLKSKNFKVEEAKWQIDGRKVMEDYTVLMIELSKYFGNMDEKMKKLNQTKYDSDPLVYALYVTYRDIDKDKLQKMVDKVWDNEKNYENKMNKFHEKYDIFITPTNAYIAPLASESLIDIKDEKNMYNIEFLNEKERLDLLNRQWEPMLIKTPFTQIYNLIGEPAISVPLYNIDNMPFGIMVNGKWGSDKMLLEFSKYLLENKDKKTITTRIAE